MSKKSNQFSPEVRERAVRMVREHRGEYPSLWAAIESIAPKIGCVPQTLHEWVKRDQIDRGVREGITTSEREQMTSTRAATDTDVSRPLCAVQRRKSSTTNACSG